MEHDFVAGLKPDERIRNINAIDTAHDFTKGKRVASQSVKDYIKNLLQGVGLHPVVQKLITDKTHSVEHIADKKFNLLTEDRIASFQTVATDIERRKDFIHQQPIGHRTPQPLPRIVIPYSFMQTSLPTWFQSMFAQYSNFVLDVTVLPEEVFCKIPNHALKIQKSLATRYDRVAENKIVDGCMVEHTPPVSLHRAAGELLFLSEASMPHDDHMIHWKYKDALEGKIDVRAVIQYSTDGKGLTLFGNMIGELLGVEVATQNGSRKRKSESIMTASKKMKVDTNTLSILQSETSKLIESLYGLPLPANSNGDKIREYIGILTDFKRMGDLLQIKVAAADPKTIFVTNDIVSSIMASVGYNCPTMRTSRRNAEDAEEDDTNEDRHSDRAISLFNIQLESGDVIYKRMNQVFTEYLRVYENIQQKWKGLQVMEAITSLQGTYKKMLDVYTDDSYIFLPEGNIREQKTDVNLGKHMMGVVVIYIQKMLIILQSFHNIIHANYDVANIAKETPSQTYHHLQKFFADARIPLPNTLFTSLPVNLNIQKILRYIDKLIQAIDAFLEHNDHRNLSKKRRDEFIELYHFISFPAHMTPYVEILDFPSKSLLSITDALHSFHQQNRNAYWRDGVFMEVGFVRTTQQPKAQGVFMSIASMVKENDTHIKRIITAQMPGGYSIKADLIKRVLTLPQTRQTITNVISDQVISVMPKAVTKRLTVLPQTRESIASAISEKIVALPEIKEVVSQVISKEISLLPKTTKKQVSKVAKQIASMPLVQKAISDAIIAQIASKAKTRKAVSAVVLQEINLATSIVPKSQPNALPVHAPKAIPNAPQKHRAISTASILLSQSSAIVSIKNEMYERINLFDMFLDVLWMKAMHRSLSPKRQEQMTVLFFQLSLIKDVLRWNIPILIPAL